MKIFIVKLIIFIIIIIVIDRLFGIVCHYLNSHAKGEATRSQYYIAKKSSEEIIMMGSSRMHHHYFPKTIETASGMSVYNAGVDGNGIILSYGYLLMVTARYSPKIIIYDISSFDQYKDDNLKYLDYLKDFYEEPGIKEIFFDVDRTERWKMLSKFYQYNSKFPKMINDYIFPVKESQQGYIGLKMKMKNEIKDINMNLLHVADPLKIQYMEKFINLCQAHNIALYFCISPVYMANDSPDYCKPAKDLCKKYNIPLFDFHADEEISVDKQYFTDRVHMNDVGAKAYTLKLCKEFKDRGIF